MKWATISALNCDFLSYIIFPFFIQMRSEYGKLLYLIQDAVSPTIKPELGFSVKKEVSERSEASEL